MPPLDLSLVSANLWASAPIWSLSAAAMIVLVVGAFRPSAARSVVPALSLAGTALAAVVAVYAYAAMSPVAMGMQVLDLFTVVFDIFVLAAVAIAIVISSPYLNRENIARGEYYALMMFSAAGAMLMAASDNLIMMFLGLELLSIPLYVLAAFARSESDSQEAGLKYFLLGSFASAFFVFGAGLAYLSAGSTGLAEIAMAFVVLPKEPGTILTIGITMVLVALAFKVALVPFHMWTPDVYEGAPTSVTAFMAVVAKAAGFGALVRLPAVVLATDLGDWNALLWGLSAATMIWGNLLAISQHNIKRLLAYSSIAHAGYLLMGILAGSAAGISAMLYYLIAYGAMTFGAFAVVIVLAGKDDRFENIYDYRGAARRSPMLGWLMLVFMFSLAGIPPFAGFFGKLYLFLAAIQSGYVGLTVIAVLTSVVAVFYYIRVLVVMWMEEAGVQERTEAIPAPPLTRTVLAALAILVVGLGILSTPVLRWTDYAAEVAYDQQIPAFVRPTDLLGEASPRR